MERESVWSRMRSILALVLCFCMLLSSVTSFAENGDDGGTQGGNANGQQGENLQPAPILEEEATPAPEGEATPAPEGEATPAPEGEATPVPEGEATPVPEGEATPVPEGEATPAPEVEATPVPEGEATPAPEGEATPAPEGEATPVPEGEATPAPEAEATPAPEGGATPVPEITVEPTPVPTPEPVYEITLSGMPRSVVGGTEFTVKASGLPADSVYSYKIVKGDEVVVSGDSGPDMSFTLYRSGSYTLQVSGRGAVAEMPVTVSAAAPTAVWFNTKSIGYGESFKLDVCVEPWYAETTFSYQTSAKKYITVDENGLIKGVKRGSSYITVTTSNGLSYNAKVTVMKTPSSVKLTAGDTTLGVGETTQLTWKLSSGSASGTKNIEILNSSAANVLSVDSSGLVTALNPGTATVRVSTYSGKSAEVSFTVGAAPTWIELPASDVISVKDKKTLAASVTDGSVTTITYSSSDTSVAQIDSTGKITAVKAGSTVITARTHNGLVAKCQLTVTPAPTKVTLNYTTITIGVGETFKLSGTVLPEGAASTLRFKSKSTKYATVDEDGTVTAKRAGTVYIYAYTYNDKSAKCKVVICSAPGSVELNTKAVTLGYDAVSGKGESYKLTAKMPNKTASSSLTYSITAQSSDGVASVDNTGKVTAHGIGWVDVTVKTHNGKTDTCRVTVMPATTSLTISPLAKTVIGVGQSVTLDVNTDSGTAGNFTVSASPEGIVSIDSYGVIKGVKAGNVKITATTFNGYSATAEMQVVDAPSKVTVQKRKETIGVGDTFAIVASVPTGSMTDLTYTSSKPSVASVDENGVVTALKAGSATITVRTHNKKKTTVTITVRKAPTSISFKTSEVFIHTGETSKPGVTISKSSSTTYVYSSANTAVATVSADGTITAVGKGTTTVSVKTHNGLTASVTVNVIEAPSEIVINDGKAVVTGVGITSKLPVVVYTASGDVYEGNVTVKSSSSSYLKVSNGTMVGKKRGKVTVTVKAGSIEKTFTVEVKRYSDIVEPKIIAHRGNGGGYPENSLEAIVSAVESGATWVEIDVRRTKDGVLVLCHDDTVDRMSNGTGKVSEMTYEELLALDFGGTKICTFEQAAEAVKNSDLSFMVEFKDEGVAADSIAIIHKYGIQDKTLYGSFKMKELQTVRSIDPDATTAFIYGSGSYYTDTAIKIALDNNFDALFPKYSAITEAISSKIHQNGLLLGTYTVNTASQYNRVNNAGVDFISTDVPKYIYDLEN